MRSSRFSCAFLGLGQGLALWTLYQRWPKSPPGLTVAFVLATFVVVSGMVVHFAWTGRDRGRLAWMRSEHTGQTPAQGETLAATRQGRFGAASPRYSDLMVGDRRLGFQTSWWP